MEEREGWTTEGMISLSFGRAGDSVSRAGAWFARDVRAECARVTSRVSGRAVLTVLFCSTTTIVECCMFVCMLSVIVHV